MIMSMTVSMIMSVIGSMIMSVRVVVVTLRIGLGFVIEAVRIVVVFMRRRGAALLVTVFVIVRAFFHAHSPDDRGRRPSSCLSTAAFPAVPLPGRVSTWNLKISLRE